MIWLIFILSILITGLALLAAGLVVLLKSSQKLAGWIVIGVGIVFIVVPVLLILATVITTTIQT